MIIPRKEALQARLEELGLAWEDRETLTSLEKRVARATLKVPSSMMTPETAQGVKCFSYFYDENADPCSHRHECLLTKDCVLFTTIRFEDLVINAGKPRRRCLEQEVI